MSRVRSTDTRPERLLRSALHREGYRFRKHVGLLPGRPDLVFRKLRVVVFVDGDFWHGYRYERWRATLSPFWQNKIDNNRSRDKRNAQRLRRAGYKVIRIWEHQLESNLASCVDRVRAALRD